MCKPTALSKTLLLVVLACAAPVVMSAGYAASVGRVSAAHRPQLSAAGFGALTLEAGQTARLNVVNAVLVQPEDATRGDGPGPHAARRGARTVTLAFDIYAPAPATDDGARLVTRYEFLRRESQEVTLRPGEGASFEFTAAEGTRVGAVVIGPPDARGPEQGGTQGPDLLTTLEVREGGSTAFMHPGSLRGFNPQPDPPGHQ